MWYIPLHLDASGAKVDAVYYNNLVALNGAVSHSGDEVTGQASAILSKCSQRQQLRFWRLKPIVSARWLRWDGLGRLCQASQSGAAMIRFYSPQIQNHTNKIKKQYNYPICSCSVQSYAVCRCQAMLAAMSWIIPMCWSTKLVAGYHGWIPISYAIEI